MSGPVCYDCKAEDHAKCKAADGANCNCWCQHEDPEGGGGWVCEHTHPELWAEGRALVQAIHDRKNNH